MILNFKKNCGQLGRFFRIIFFLMFLLQILSDDDTTN